MENKMNLQESIRNDLNKISEAPKYPLTGEEARQSWLDASREEADKLSHEQGTFDVEVTIKTTVQVSAESAEYAEQEAEMMASNGELNIVGDNSEVTAVVMTSLDEADTATFNNLPIGWKVDGAYASYVDAKTGLEIDMAVGATTLDFAQPRDWRLRGIIPELEVVSKTEIEKDEVWEILRPFFASFGEVKLMDVVFQDRGTDYVSGYVEFASKRDKHDDIERMVSVFGKKIK
jgi:hypothetical protein